VEETMVYRIFTSLAGTMLLIALFAGLTSGLLFVQYLLRRWTETGSA
jgi:hypothetical protein